ncbi:MAG: hypothetical protein JSU91_00440 [Thermoplasmatales archaeon]|nr:MAG: hypothetical protein JSU91_00440 [Thermoplasmatales archaeon]
MKERYVSILTLFIISLLVLCGCTTNETNKNEAEKENETVSDECGNDVGNGFEIITGPDIDAFEGDVDNPFRSLSVHPTDPDTILVGTEGNGFLKSTDGGNSWERLRLGLRHSELGYPEIYDISWSQSNPEIIYAATTNGPGPVTGSIGSDAGIYKSTDGGQTWVRKNCNIPCSAILSVYVDSIDEDHVFVGVEDGKSTRTGTYFSGGMYETTDGGERWELVELGPLDYQNTYVLFRCSKDEGTLITYGLDSRYDKYSTDDIGFLKSNDSGFIWEEFAPELKSIGVSFFDISSDGSKIYVVAEGVFYISTDAGVSWTNKDMHTGALYFVSVSPADKNRVLFGKDADLYLSKDGLDTFEKVIEIERTGSIHFADIVFAPSSPNIVYAITTGDYPSTPGYNLYRSNNSGDSFTKIVNLRTDVLNVIP